MLASLQPHLGGPTAYHAPTFRMPKPKVPKPKLQLPAPSGGILRQDTNPGAHLAPGVGVMYDPSGKALRFVQASDPNRNKQVKLAAGWGIEYDDNGKPIRFVHTGPTGGSASPAVAPTPGAAAPGAPAPAADSTPDPRDAGYWAAIDGLTRTRDTDLASLDHQHDANVADRDAQIQALVKALAADRQSTTEGSNKQGLFYSSTLSKRLADVEGDNSARQAAAQAAYARAETGLADQRRGILDAFHTGSDNAFGDAVGRRSALDEQDVAPVAPPPAVTNPAVAKPKKPPFERVKVKGGVWHVYPDGHKVFVRK